MSEMTHFGDPCIHCLVPHDEVAAGECKGDPDKAVPIMWCSMGVRWDGVERYRIRYSDNHIEDRWEHVGFQLPYYHFGASRELKHPPRYNETLARTPKPGETK